jgi:hypothetical protein
MIAEPITLGVAAQRPNPAAQEGTRPSATYAGSKPGRGDWKCPMCMEDVEIHLFHRAIRDAMFHNPKLWKPLEKGFNALIGEDPVRSGSLANALRDVVQRNPRLLDNLEQLLNAPSAEYDWFEYTRTHDATLDSTTPATSNPAESILVPDSQVQRHATVYDTTTNAPPPPTPQNATLCNTVATAASPPALHDATVCNTATTVDSSDPEDDRSDAPISRLDRIDDRESVGAGVAAHLSDLGRPAQAETDAHGTELFREAEEKGGSLPYACDEKPHEETTDPTPSKLKVKQQLAITALLGGASQSAAAEAAGVDRSTLYRWMKRDAEFVAAYNRVKHDHYDTIHARMFQITNQMMDTLENLLKRPFSTTSDRLRMISVGLQLRKQIMAQRAPDCPTDAKVIENTWRALGASGPYCHEFPASAD